MFPFAFPLYEEFSIKQNKKTKNLLQKPKKLGLVTGSENCTGPGSGLKIEDNLRFGNPQSRKPQKLKSFKVGYFQI